MTITGLAFHLENIQHLEYFVLLTCVFFLPASLSSDLLITLPSIKSQGLYPSLLSPRRLLFSYLLVFSPVASLLFCHSFHSKHVLWSLKLNEQMAKTSAIGGNRRLGERARRFFKMQTSSSCPGEGAV